MTEDYMTIETEICYYEDGGRYHEPVKVRHVVLEIRESHEKDFPLRASRRKVPGIPLGLAQ